MDSGEPSFFVHVEEELTLPELLQELLTPEVLPSNTNKPYPFCV